MNIIILAGGLGTRLHPITKDKYPKCMVEVNNGKPFLYYLLKKLVEENSIDSFILSIGHRKEHITDYFGNDFYGVPIYYCTEVKPLGTGGAIKFALESIYSKNYPVIVLNGDTFTTIDLNKMMILHKEKKALVTVAVKFIGDVSKSGHVIFDKNKKMIEYIEKGNQIPGYINAGAYVIDEVIKSELPDEGSFEKDFLQKSAAGVYVFDKVYDFIDIGIPKDYKGFTNIIKAKENK